jgi:hypothetical protein
MRVEIVEEYEGKDRALVIPPGAGFVDLRENPHSIEQIAVARQYLPLRNFLGIINGAESPFATVSATVKCDSPAADSSANAYEFASQVSLVFAEIPLNFDRERYRNLNSSLKELLERDPGNAVRATLRISLCEFPGQNRRGFCLEIRLVAEGETTEQAELRWGLGLARMQQALLFRARTLKQQASL